MAKIVFLMLVLIVILCNLTAFCAPTKMPSGFYYPTDRTTWTGTGGGAVGDPKQPWNDGSSGGRIYGFLDPDAPKYLGKNHVGMDIRQAYNSPVYAIADGTIYIYSTEGGSRYYCVIVQHRDSDGNYFYAVYGHCRINTGLSEGSHVAAGQIIAYVNENVNQHMHFGIKMDPNFDTGWGYLDLGLDAYAVGWRPPRTWLSSNYPYGVDVSAPSIAITGASPNTSYPSLQQVTWNVTDAGSGVSSTTLQWDSGVPVSVSAVGSQIIPNGSHTVTIRATDNSGNSSSSTSGPYLVSAPSMVVSAPPSLFPGGYFVERPDRASGLYVDLGSSSVPNFALGDRVDILGGSLIVSNGETVLQNGILSKAEGGDGPQPLGINVRDVATGMAAGLLVTVTGQVSYREPDGSAFYVDDGSPVSDGYHNGIRVLCSGFVDGTSLNMPESDFVSVTGIRWTAAILGSMEPVIYPRWQADILER